MALTYTETSEQQNQQPAIREREEEQRARGRKINVGENERYGSVIGGASLLLAAVARRGLSGALLGALGLAFIQRGVTGHCGVFQRLGINTAKSNRPGVPDNVGIKVERSVTIARPPEEIFRLWRDFSNLPKFMEHIQRVDIIDDKRSHWVARGPGGRQWEWDAEVINEHPDSMISWESLPGAEVQNAGTVRFNPAPGGRGTEVRVVLEYNPPGGVLGSMISRLFGESPEDQIDMDLLRLKQMLEAGEIATIAGQPAGAH